VFAAVFISSRVSSREERTNLSTHPCGRSITQNRSYFASQIAVSGQFPGIRDIRPTIFLEIFPLPRRLVAAAEKAGEA
jgi:hypothetical protein